MKFSIENILAGIAAKRQSQLRDGEANIAHLRKSMERLEERARSGAAAYKVLLEEELDGLSANVAAFKESVGIDIEALKRLKKELPYSYDVSNVERDIARIEENLEIIRTSGNFRDSYLAEFLRALQAGGETHITQNALKTAGFGDHKISEFIIALERTKQEDA